jgi:hypothetical protein
MAEPTPVNGMITDAVTQANVSVLGDAPAMAMGSLYQSMTHSIGLAFENAVSAQQQANIAALAATTQGVMQLYGFGAAAAFHDDAAIK